MGDPIGTAASLFHDGVAWLQALVPGGFGLLSIPPWATLIRPLYPDESVQTAAFMFQALCLVIAIWGLAKIIRGRKP